MLKSILHVGVPIHEVPSYPENIYKHLKKRGIQNFLVMVKNDDNSIETRNIPGSFAEFGRLIFVITKDNPVA